MIICSNNPDRPDADGFVTKEEGIGWAKENPGEDIPLFNDAQNLDLGRTHVNDFDSPGDTKDINLLYKGTPKDVFYAYGSVSMTLVNSAGQVSIGKDKFDWDYHDVSKAHGFTSKAKEVARNAGILKERTLHNLNDNHGFTLFTYGLGQIRKD